ncbi:MAG: energy-coupling factor ABC transporter permease [bacterium]|nr:MAG: energy-coupling factor ABC transporter permease [bacterium]
MHMADALISPVVGAAAWAATAGAVGHSSRKLREELDGHRIPLMGVLGAFIFAAQMVNFTIPATGSSGHLGGGLILAALLGPQAAFLTLASVLTVQALFFADGGLLALGCNILNLGFFPCFVAYPFIYRKIAGGHMKRWRITTGALAGAVAGLQLGALGVVLETWLSGISELPLRTFLFLMQPIHLAIGLVEGLATAAVVLFVVKARPEILRETEPATGPALSPRALAAVFLGAAIVLGGGVSYFASVRPDGLEWALSRISGPGAPGSTAGEVHDIAGDLQDRTAVLPDYGFREGGRREPAAATDGTPDGSATGAGKAVSGLVGGLLTLLIAGAAGFFLKRRHNAAARGGPAGS